MTMDGIYEMKEGNESGTVLYIRFLLLHSGTGANLSSSVSDRLNW